MGGFVAIQAAALAPEAVRRIVSIDAVGFPDPLAAAVIMRVALRLAGTSHSEQDYLQRVRQMGVFHPWDEYWERSFRYELARADGVFRARTSMGAVMEDALYAGRRNPWDLWRSLDMPVLLVRAGRPLVSGIGSNGAGWVVSASDRDRFLATVPHARAVEVDASHYGILMHPATARAVTGFLDGT